MAELAMLADRYRTNHKVVTHLASSLAQDRESSPAETSLLIHYNMLRQHKTSKFRGFCFAAVPKPFQTFFYKQMYVQLCLNVYMYFV